MVVLVLIVLGLCFGSFVNAFIWRLHELETKKNLSHAQKKKLSIINGRSMCPHCHHELSWQDLLPLVSWLSLRGKCRYCGRKIDDNPLVELLTAVVFAGSYLVWPYGFETAGWVFFGFWLVFVVGFMALIAYDLRWMLLPNRVVYPLLGLSILQLLLRIAFYGNAADTLIEALWGFLMVGGLFWLLFQVSGGKWIGGGDVKLGFMIGSLVGGPLNGLLVLFLASLLGCCVSLPLMARRSLRATSRIPFGPFLLAATIIVYLYGVEITEWYTRTFL